MTWRRLLPLALLAVTLAAAAPVARRPGLECVKRAGSRVLRCHVTGDLSSLAVPPWWELDVPGAHGPVCVQSWTLDAELPPGPFGLRLRYRLRGERADTVVEGVVARRPSP